MKCQKLLFRKTIRQLNTIIFRDRKTIKSMEQPMGFPVVSKIPGISGTVPAGAIIIMIRVNPWNDWTSYRFKWKKILSREQYVICIRNTFISKARLKITKFLIHYEQQSQTSNSTRALMKKLQTSEGLPLCRLIQAHFMSS